MINAPLVERSRSLGVVVDRDQVDQMLGWVGVRWARVSDGCKVVEGRFACPVEDDATGGCEQEHIVERRPD